MPQKKTHKDVEFSVLAHGGKEKIFRRFDEAVAFAVVMSVGDSNWQNVDVLIHSRAGARWWGGDYAVEEYEADPEASVSDRIVVKARSEGRIA